MPAQTSLAVAQGATVRYTDHNKMVADIAAIIAEKGAASGLASLNVSSKVVQSPADGVVGTAALAANAVTEYGTVELLNTTFATGSTSFVDITGLSFSMTVTGGDLIIFFETSRAAYGTDGGNVTIGVNINGTDYQMLSRNLLAGNGTGSFIASVIALPGIPAGTYTIKGRQKSTNGNNCTIGSNPGQIRLVVVELKR